MPAARQTGNATARGTCKGVTDLTGREDERLKAANADAVEEAAKRMAIVNTLERKHSDDVVDYTDDARPKVDIKPAAEPPKPQKYRVRVLADIENMTFGKEVVDPGDFTDPNNPRMPTLGSLKTYDFQEGREYIVDAPLYEHLKGLGYLYE